MVLAFYNECIIDAEWSIGLALTYFTHPDYLFGKCWVYATHLSPDTNIQIGSHTYWYIKFFQGGMVYMPQGAH